MRDAGITTFVPMTHPIGNYVSIHISVKFRRQAVIVWMTALAVVLFWVAVILMAPMTAANGLNNFSAPIYTFFSYICHQMPERSMHIDGYAIAVCSRCFGVYFGLLAGFAIYPLLRRIEEIEPLARFWLFLSMIPISIDWSFTMLGIWENTHLSRFVTGSILGTACGIYIVPALVEIFRNLSRTAETRM